MSATLALKVAAPVFAFAIAGLIWAVAGPLAAGLSLVTFLMGVVTSELDHMRWRPVAEPAADPGADSALLALMEVRGSAPPEPAAAPPPRPRHYYRATRNEMAIGSGGRRRTLQQRTWRAPPSPLAPEPVGPYTLQADEEELFAAAFGPVSDSTNLSEPDQDLAPVRANAVPAGGAAELRASRAEPPPPKVTVFRSAYAERVGRR